MRQTLGRLVPAAVFAGCITVLIAIYVDDRSQLRFVRAEREMWFEGSPKPGELIDTITTAFGVYVNFEYPCQPGGKSAYIPPLTPSAKPGDTLDYVFNTIEKQSNGLFEAVEIAGLLCIVPSEREMAENRSNLDRVISLRIGEVSAFDALHSIVEAVNQYHVTGYPLRFNPGGIYAGYAPPPAFLTDPIRPIHANNITARQAVSRVIARTNLPCSWVYGHMRDAAYLTVRFHDVNGRVQTRTPTAEEKQRWDAYIASQP
jgi:hypothetical protein